MKTKTIVWLLIVCTIILATVEALTVGLPKIENSKVILWYWGVVMFLSFLCNLIQRRPLKIMLRDVGGGLLLLGFILAAYRFSYILFGWLDHCEDDVLLFICFLSVSLYPVCVCVVALWCYCHWFSGWRENQNDMLAD